MEDGLPKSSLPGTCPVTHGAGIRRVMGDPQFTVAPYGRGYESLRRRNAHRFPHIEFALNYLPVAHDGPRHAELRDMASRYFQSRNEAMKACRQQLARDAAAVFRQGGRIDLLRDIVDPAVEAMVRELSGVRSELSPSLIFDPATSLRKRREIDAELGRLIAQLLAADPDGGEDSAGIRLIFAVLVNDASRGMLSSNLAAILTAGRGKRLSEIDWPPQPVETGIRFIDRCAAGPTELDGVLWPAGTVFRNEFNALSREGDTATLFGIGRHVCLGRGFFWAYWRDLTSALAALGSRVLAADIGPVTDRVFAIPDFAVVEVEGE
jgi:cytochrome P450